MVSEAITAFLCICCWLHGATIGIAVGDSVEVYQFFIFTCGIVVFITIMWFYSPQSRRIGASLIYLVCSIFLTSIVKSISWFRTPKLQEWTTLPDIGHDIFQNISILNQTNLSIPLFGSTLTKRIPNMLLFFIVILTIIFVSCHSKSSIIIRRFIMIYATLMLVRAIIAIVTFLPDSNPICANKYNDKNLIQNTFPDAREIVRRLFQSWIPVFVGEQNGCRDIIFCGHTIMLILCGMTWHTYYKWVPSIVNKVKACIWVYILLVIIISLGQKQNYTLDVVLSIYFTITTWATYHRLANDVITGHSFSCVWLIDKMIIYPVIEWMEAFVIIETAKYHKRAKEKEKNKYKLYRRDETMSNDIHFMDGYESEDENEHRNHLNHEMDTNTNDKIIQKDISNGFIPDETIYLKKIYKNKKKKENIYRDKIKQMATFRTSEF